MTTPILYLHGFASGPSSAKGRAFEELFGRIGVALQRADLTPGADGFERSTPLTMLAEAERALTATGARAVMGSSLGGYLAALLASRHASVERLVLLAPAFRLFERWRARLTPEQVEAWKTEGLWVDHHVTGNPRRIGYRFLEDAATLPAFPEVRVPTLCFAGRRDETVPLEDVAAFVDRTPGARLVALDDGHELVASVPRIFEEAREFLVPGARVPEAIR
ncbi:MAG TPA: YqiA/YcfP family alpha/beta fold hydrolase [Anaeromyxobacteraceae bacterium]|nr:YqiA/YcfP family alpha/beta fold hydrolase [Anaeromyxobacteraceae bacterium]